MIECTYCRRIFKRPHHICPGCGAKSFEVKFYKENLIIKKTPNDGYKSCINAAKKERKKIIIKLLINIILLLIIAMMALILPIYFFKIASNEIVILMVRYIILIMAVSSLKFLIPICTDFIKEFKENKKKIEMAKKLSKDGILIKNLEYEIKDNYSLFGKKKYKIIVKYIAENGKEQIIRPKKLFDENQILKDDTVDLLIDPQNRENYYVDFEIY